MTDKGDGSLVRTPLQIALFRQRYEYTSLPVYWPYPAIPYFHTQMIVNIYSFTSTSFYHFRCYTVAILVIFLLLENLSSIPLQTLKEPDFHQILLLLLETCHHLSHSYTCSRIIFSSDPVLHLFL